VPGVGLLRPVANSLTRVRPLLRGQTQGPGLQDVILGMATVIVLFCVRL
jgi:hypothetical protein